tara:strand:+ start:1366 stop:1599 length:234 start_codon:yes stop_codon:yes gene_type:complete
MKRFTVDISVGDTAMVGRYKNVPIKIVDIELDDHGQPVLISNTGKKHLFACRIDKLSPGGVTPAQIKARAKSATRKK